METNLNWPYLLIYSPKTLTPIRALNSQFFSTLGRTVAVTSHFELGQAIEAGSRLKLKIVKKGLIPITIPCMDVSHLVPKLFHKNDLCVTVIDFVPLIK